MHARPGVCMCADDIDRRIFPFNYLNVEEKGILVQCRIYINGH